MFEGVGTDRDDERSRRRAAALLMTLAGLSSVGGFGLAISVWFAARQVAAVPVVDPEIAMVVEIADALPPPPPDAPLPPPPPKAAGRADSTEQPTSEVAPEVPAPLKTPDDKPAAPPGGSPSGTDGGDPNGKDGGKVDGHVGGTGDGPPSGPEDRIHVFAHQELEIRRQTQPDYPASAPQDLGSVRCIATVRIDEDGVPYSAEARGCPEPFATETREELLKWRWYPPKVNKAPTKAQTAIAVTYTLH